MLALISLFYEENQLKIERWIKNHIQWHTPELVDALPPKDAVRPEADTGSQPAAVLPSQPKSPGVLLPGSQSVSNGDLARELKPDPGPDAISQQPAAQPDSGSRDPAAAAVKDSSEKPLNTLAIPQIAEIIFGFDSTSLSSEGKASLEAVAQYLVASGIEAGRLVVRGQGIYRNAVESGSDVAVGQTIHGRIVRVDVETNSPAP